MNETRTNYYSTMDKQVTKNTKWTEITDWSFPVKITILPRFIWYKPQTWKYLSRKWQKKISDSLRGKRAMPHRPTKIIIDDPQGRKNE